MLYTLGILGGHEDMLGELFEEIYAAVRGGQYRLAGMGIRSLLEQVMISKVGDQGDFRKNIDAFHQNGFISLVQRDAMSAILDAGHAVTDRLFKPTVRDLNTALDITEGIFAAIYVHRCGYCFGRQGAKARKAECRFKGRLRCNYADGNRPRFLASAASNACASGS
jgi:Domain of unknown function (DUF4145)